MGATISRSDVFPEMKSRISSTWDAGDIIVSVQGALTIDAIHNYDFLDNATERGRQFVESVRDADFAGGEDVRGKGLILAVEFGSQDRCDGVLEIAFEQGLWTYLHRYGDRDSRRKL